MYDTFILAPDDTYFRIITHKFGLSAFGRDNIN
jgi:hypothetical protein